MEYVSLKGSEISVAIVDDERDVAEALCRILSALGICDVVIFNGSEEFCATSNLGNRFDVVFLDLVMPGKSGFDVLKLLSQEGGLSRVVVLSAYSSTENVVESMRLGAFDFLPKPFDVEDVGLALQKVSNDLAVMRIEQEVHSEETADSRAILQGLPGKSEQMEKLRKVVQVARGVNVSTLIVGETGTGKELVAKCVHGDQGPLVSVNASSVPKDLLESELFGHVAGAFTGAVGDKEGLICKANGGTLFLDEINSLDVRGQTKLLRVLQEKSVRPVGSNNELGVDFRLVCATNEPLERLIESRQFRLDLFHRINVVKIRVPPLRERLADIPELADFFLKKYCGRHGRGLKILSDHAISRLREYRWPGNVRELENAIERAVLFSGDLELIDDSFFVFDAPPLEKERVDPVFEVADMVSLDRVSRDYCKSVLHYCGGNKAEACRVLDIDYKTLVKKLS